VPKKTVVKSHLTQRVRSLSRMGCPTTVWVNRQNPDKLPLAECAFPDTIKKQTEQSGDRMASKGQFFSLHSLSLLITWLQCNVKN
jgi:hypothetical protein